MSFFAYIGTFSWLVWVLLILGIVLLVIEMLQPGLGAPGAIGIVLLIAAIALQAKSILEALIMLAVLAAIIGLIFLVFIRSFYKGRLSKSSILLNDQAKARDLEELKKEYVGQKGVAVTPLRPVGTGRFGEKQFEVVARGEFIAKDTPLEIIAVDGIQMIVKAAEETDEREG